MKGLLDAQTTEDWETEKTIEEELTDQHGEPSESKECEVKQTEQEGEPPVGLHAVPGLTKSYGLTITHTPEQCKQCLKDTPDKRRDPNRPTIGTLGKTDETEKDGNHSRDNISTTFFF